MLTDCDSDRVSRVKARDDFSVSWTDRLDSFGDSRLFKKHGLRVSKIATRKVANAGSFEMGQIPSSNGVKFVQTEDFFVRVFGFGLETCFHKSPSQTVESFNIVGILL